eukprot:SAG11_NODE_12233_length_714_cov_1.250407_1_plen_53_part_10
MDAQVLYYLDTDVHTVQRIPWYTLPERRQEYIILAVSKAGTWETTKPDHYQYD